MCTDTISVLDCTQLDGALRPAFIEQLRVSCLSTRAFYLVNHGISAQRYAEILAATAQFFALPEAQKQALHISPTRHYRGFSQMKNSRDWREQMHFGMEETPVTAPDDFWRLQGSNQWPQTLGDSWRQLVLGIMADMTLLGHKLLAAVAESLGQPSERLTSLIAHQPYTLMKQICYYPQSQNDTRSGVAAHCDWSLLTFLLQDNVGGLEIMLPSGQWQALPPLENALSVNIGELLEIISGGIYSATPHRVINLSQQQKRFSLPFFINPALDAKVPIFPRSHSRISPVELEHVHRVVKSGTVTSPFHFGASEWRRKGLGQWCYHLAQSEEVP